MPGRKGRSGPKPKPTSLKILHGSFEKDPSRRNKREPVPQDKTPPACPSHLGRLAKNEWKRIVKELQSLKVMAKVDREALEQYCAAYQSWRECLKDVRKRGVVLTKIDNGGNEIRYRNPADIAMVSHTKTIHTFLTEFGLTPSSRTRVQIDEKVETRDDAKKRFLA